MTLRELIENMDVEQITVNEVVHLLGVTRAEAIRQLRQAYAKGWITAFIPQPLNFVFEGIE